MQDYFNQNLSHFFYTYFFVSFKDINFAKQYTDLINKIFFRKSSKIPKQVMSKIMDILIQNPKYEQLEQRVRELEQELAKHKHAEKVFKENEERYRFITENSSDITLVSDDKGYYLYVSPSHKRLLGRGMEVLGRSIFEHIHPEDVEQAMGKFEYGLSSVDLVKAEYRYYHPERGYIWLESVGQRHHAFNKNIRIVITSRDITKRKQAEEEMHQSEEKLSQIVYGNPIATFVIDQDHRVTHWNTACERLTGLSKERMSGSDDQWRAFYTEKRPVMADLVIEEFPERKIKQYYPNKWRKSSLIKYAYEVEDFFTDLGKQGKWLFFTAAPLFDHNGRVIGAIETLQDITERKQTENNLQQAMSELLQTKNDLKGTLDKLNQTVHGTILTLSSVLEKRDPYTSGHQERVTQLACAIAKELGLEEDRIQGLYFASVVHDIGKISVPAEILARPTQLSDKEFELIKEHPQAGFDILKDIEFPWPIADIVVQHHERLNGSGYPKGLSGEEILLEAKILAVADVVEAMASHRPYRPAMGIEAALKQIEKNKGILHDSKVVEACVSLFCEQNFTFDKARSYSMMKSIIDEF